MRRALDVRDRVVAPAHPAPFALGAALLVFVLILCAPSSNLVGYVDASVDQSSEIAEVVREYYRTRNALAGDTNADTLWQKYPSLAHSRNVAAGVNVELEFVERTRRLGVHVVTTDESAYEPLRVLVRDNDAVAFVHGEEQWMLPAGDKTKFEITTLLYLARRDGRWAIVKTDERVLGEGYPSLPPRPRS